MTQQLVWLSRPASRVGVYVAAGFVLAVVRCFAQQPPGPPTLENLLQGEATGQAKPATTPPAAITTGTAVDSPPTGRPQGTLVRPKDGINHPDLDKAWVEYEAAVAKAAETLRAAIASQFDAATAKGDLDAAEKWQAALEKFEKSGTVPDEKELKSQCSAAATAFSRGREQLLKAYDGVVKALTIDKNLAAARQAKNEHDLLEKAPTTPQVASGAPAKVPEKKTPKEPAWEDITGTVVGGERQGNMIVVRPGAPIRSAKEYAPPIDIEYACAIADDNIRLGYACQQMIFNWEVTRNELRIDGGPANGRHVRGAGQVPAGELILIRQIVLPGEMIVYVNGEQRARWGADFSSVRDKITVEVGSEFRLRSIRIRTPPAK